MLYETNTKNVNCGIVRNKGRRETYGGRRSSAQVGLLAKAFRDGDQFVTALWSTLIACGATIKAVVSIDSIDDSVHRISREKKRNVL